MKTDVIEKIIELAKPNIEFIDGRSYTDKRLTLLQDPPIDAITLSSLSSLVDLLENQQEVDHRAGTIVHIESPTHISVRSHLQHERFRDVYYVVSPDLPRIPFDTFVDLEKFNILLQANFIDSEHRQKVLAVVGNVRSSQVQSIDDDGISQQVEVKVGIQKLATAVVPNPVLLAPYRTFHEIEQPTSAFVLRMKDGPLAALFEADGGAWKAVAVNRIKAYLEERLTEDILVIA